MRSVGQFRFFAAVVIWLLTVVGAAADHNDGIFAGAKFIRDEELAPGVRLRQYEYHELYGGRQFVSVAEIELDRPGLELGVGVCDDRIRMTPSVMARRDRALLAINGGFFVMADPSQPAGALRHGGVTVSAGDIGNGAGGVVAFTGNQVAIRPIWELADALRQENLRASSPLLLDHGNICVNEKAAGIAGERHPRTAVGLDGKGIFYWVVFDGRANGRAIGVDCRSLADFMRRLGCVYALNMDGGGSTAMWTKKYGIVNHPSDNHRFDAAGERPVYDILYVRLVCK